MDQSSVSHPAQRSRRRHSPEFKAMVLKACQAPGNSIAGVARQYQLNANLVHKWRRQFEQPGSAAFVALPTPDTAVISHRATATVRLELPGGLVAHWPADHILASVPWLQALQS